MSDAFPHPITETIRKLAEASGVYSRTLSGGADPLWVTPAFYDQLKAAGTDMTNIRPYISLDVIRTD